MKVKVEERQEISMIGNSLLDKMVNLEEAVASDEVEIREAGIGEADLVLVAATMRDLVAATMRDLAAEADMVLVAATMRDLAVETMRDLAVEEERMPQDQTTCFLTRISQPCEKVI